MLMVAQESEPQRLETMRKECKEMVTVNAYAKRMTGLGSPASEVNC